MATSPIDFSKYVAATPAASGPIDFSKYENAEKAAPPSAMRRFTESLGEGLPGYNKDDAFAALKDAKNGLYHIFTQPADSANLIYHGVVDPMQLTNDKAVARMKKEGVLNKVTGAIQYAESGVPFLGPQLSQAGEKFESGDVAGGLGTTAAAALPFVAPEAGELGSKGLRVTGELGQKLAPQVKQAIAVAARDTSNNLRPLTKMVSGSAGTTVGHTLLPGVGGYLGAMYGTDLANTLLPKRAAPIEAPLAAVEAPAAIAAPEQAAAAPAPPFRAPAAAPEAPPQVAPQFATESTGTVEDASKLGARGQGGTVVAQPKLLPQAIDFSKYEAPAPEPEAPPQATAATPEPAAPAPQPAKSLSLGDIVDRAFDVQKPAPNVPISQGATVPAVDDIKLKYPDPAVRQMVRANGEQIYEAAKNNPETLDALHKLTRVDLRQAMINSGEDMGQTTVSNSKFSGEGSIPREQAFNTLLAKGHTPEQIVDMAKRTPDPLVATINDPNASLFDKSKARFELAKQNAGAANPSEAPAGLSYGSKDIEGGHKQLHVAQDGVTKGKLNLLFDGDTASVSAVELHKDLQGKGIGKQLYRNAIDEAKKSGAKYLTSDLSISTTKDAANVWNALKREGLPVEEIENNSPFNEDGTPGFRIDLSKVP